MRAYVDQQLTDSQRHSPEFESLSLRQFLGASSAILFLCWQAEQRNFHARRVPYLDFATRLAIRSTQISITTYMGELTWNRSRALTILADGKSVRIRSETYLLFESRGLQLNARRPPEPLVRATDVLSAPERRPPGVVFCSPVQVPRIDRRTPRCHRKTIRPPDKYVEINPRSSCYCSYSNFSCAGFFTPAIVHDNPRKKTRPAGRNVVDC